MLFVYPNGAQECGKTATTSVNVKCDNPPIAVISNANTSFVISRTQYSHMILDGSQSRDPDSPSAPLYYWWQQISGPPTLNGIHNANTSIASFIAITSDQSYVFQLTVSDGCSNGTTITTLSAMCGTFIAPTNASVFSYYDGEVPVPYMSLGYDYSASLDPTLAAAKCQQYVWQLVDYQPQPQPFPPPPEPVTSNTGLSAGVVAGITIGVIVAVGLGGVCIFFCVKRAQERRGSHGERSPLAVPAPVPVPTPSSAQAASVTVAVAPPMQSAPIYQPPAYQPPTNPPPIPAVSGEAPPAAFS